MHNNEKKRGFLFFLITYGAINLIHDILDGRMICRERDYERLHADVEGDPVASQLLAQWGLLKFVQNPLLRSQDKFLHFLI